MGCLIGRIACTQTSCMTNNGYVPFDACRGELLSNGLWLLRVSNMLWLDV